MTDFAGENLNLWNFRPGNNWNEIIGFAADGISIPRTFINYLFSGIRYQLHSLATYQIPEWYQVRGSIRQSSLTRHRRVDFLEELE